MWAILANQATLLRTTWRFMKASEEVVRRTSPLWNCDLNDTVGYRWTGTFFRSEEFLSQFFWPKSHHWWLVRCLWSWPWNWCLSACRVVSELPVWRRVVNESELCSADRSLCLPSGFPSTSPVVRGWRWIVIIWFVHPTQQSSLLMSVLRLPWSR